MLRKRRAPGPKRSGAARAALGVAGFVVYASALAGLAGTLTLGCLLANNTLANDGQWLFTKERLEFVPNGGPSYMYEPQALAQCRLHLDAWGAYNELIYKPRMKFGRVEFDFSLHDKAYFTFFLVHDLRKFLGLRFSIDPRYPAAILTGTRDGHFDSKVPLAMGDLAPETRHHALIYGAGDKVCLRVDNRDIDLGGLAAPQTCRPGFRGGAFPVAIDNFAVNGEVLDTFLCADNWRRIFAVVAASIALVSLGLASVLRMVDVPWGKVGAGMLGTTILCLFLAVVAVGFYSRYAARYPLHAGLLKGELMFVMNNRAERDIEIADEAARVAPGSFLVLVMGTSQTFGVGASARENAFPALLQHAIDGARPQGRKVVCVDAAKSGYVARSLLTDYEERWIRLKPQVLVLNLGNNDRREPGFAEALQRFIDLDKAQGIQTVIVLEANAVEYDDPLPHPLMREIADRNQVPVVDLHEFMKDHHDDGFLWWDYVHGTDFGQRLMAECVYEGIAPLLPRE